jgi:ABC-type uncharacterized transport system permease subunit
MSWRVLGQTMLTVLPVCIVCAAYADEPFWRLVLIAVVVGAGWGLLVALTQIFFRRLTSTGRRG